MEEDGGYPARKNPKYIIAGQDDGRVFACTGGNNERELKRGLEAIAAASGGDVPKLGQADIYVKLEHGIVAPRKGFDVTIPEHP